MDKKEDRRIDREIHDQNTGSDPFAAAMRATRMPMLITDPRQPDIRSFSSTTLLHGSQAISAKKHSDATAASCKAQERTLMTSPRYGRLLPIESRSRSTSSIIGRTERCSGTGCWCRRYLTTRSCPTSLLHSWMLPANGQQEFLLAVLRSKHPWSSASLT